MRFSAHLAVIGLLVATAALAVVRADEEVDDPDTLVLTESNFDDLVKREETMLVEFYAPWCGHCKRLAPEFAKAATTLLQNDPVIRLGKLDATEHREVANRYSVSGYPTLKVFRNGVASEYKGPREADGIVAYMKKQVGPAAKPVNSVAELEKFTKSGDGNYWIVGLFNPGKDISQLHSAFVTTANQLRDDYTFLKSSDEAVRSSFDLAKGEEAIYAVKTYDDLKTRFTGHGTSQLTEFINHNALPIVGEITSQNEKFYRRRNLPIMRVFVKKGELSSTNSKQLQYYINRVEKTAKANAGKMLFALADPAKYSGELSELGLSNKELPLVIEHNDNKFVSTEKFSAKTVEDFANSFHEGSLEKHVKSEPVPDNNDGDVTVVVGKTFDDIVLDAEKDVFIEFYAPWCGHCKALTPKYEKLGKKMKKHDNVVIAKIDATANDFPRDKFDVSGYPSIFFKPAKKNATPIRYEGEREVDDMKAFIEKHATTISKKKSKKSKKSKASDDD